MKPANLLFLFAMTAAVLPATTIVAVDGSTGGFAVGIRPASTIGVEFTVDQAYTDVSIDASLDGTFSGEAYLTTQIEAGTTTADQIAASPFTSTGSAETLLLSNLTLDPGTYYLTLSTSASSGAQGIWGTASPTVITDTGASTPAGYYIVDYGGYNSSSSYPPSAFGIFETGNSLEFEVFNQSSSAPEPATWMMLAGGLLLVGIRVGRFRRS